MMDRILIDTHTHTMLSGHAWSTLRENAAAAARRGLYGLCLTDHGPTMPGSGPFFLAAAQDMLPDFIEGVRVYRGAEANIVGFDGRLDIEDRILARTEFCIASLHDLTLKGGDTAHNTEAMLGAIRNPFVDVLGHIDDRKSPVDFAAVVAEAGRQGKLIEINNNSLKVRKGSRERIAEVADLCASRGTRITVASDAHFDEMIGETTPALELLAERRFPDELIVNRSADVFEAFLAERKARTAAAASGEKEAAKQ